MLSIPCPYCGPRDYVEFRYGGDATIRRPDPARCSDADWHAYVYLRDNPPGVHDELWQHSAGCRQWIKVRRHVGTHAVLATARMDEPLDGASERGGA